MADQTEFIKLQLPEQRDILLEIHKTYDEEHGFKRDEAEYDVLVEYLYTYSDIYHPLVLLVDGRPAGYIRAYDRLSTSSCGLVMMLDLVYVLPPYRGQGLGTMLMENFIEFAENSNSARIDLLTDQDNQVAVNLYSNYGFKGRNRFQMIKFLKHHKDLLEYFESKQAKDHESQD